MRIKLFSLDTELCTLQSDPVPAGFPPHMAAHNIIEHFRDGNWIWVNKDKRAIRYEAITRFEIVDEEKSRDCLCVIGCSANGICPIHGDEAGRGSD